MRRATIAYFISSHGFGHAARACAVLEALWALRPTLRCVAFTACPRWFFRDSLSQPVSYHEENVDLGLVQTTALAEDLDATVEQLGAFLPFRDAQTKALASRLLSEKVDLVVADIAPLGLHVAAHCGLPSVLVENFTWDWIYRAYANEAPVMAELAAYLEKVFARATRHVQAEPLCRPADHALRVSPVRRPPRTSRATTRQSLGVPADAPLVMATMGGIPWNYGALDAATASGDFWLVIPGASEEPVRRGQLVLLPHRSAFYHPDLVQAADAVVGKLGYSTIAEVFGAGLPFAYVARSRFPESPLLEAWVRRHLPHRAIPEDSFRAGQWLGELPQLLALPRRLTPVANGAAQVAAVIDQMLAP